MFVYHLRFRIYSCSIEVITCYVKFIIFALVLVVEKCSKLATSKHALLSLLKETSPSLVFNFNLEENKIFKLRKKKKEEYGQFWYENFTLKKYMIHLLE